MNTTSYNHKNRIYYEHTIKKLIDKLLSDAEMDIIVKKVFYPKENPHFDEIVYADNIYLRIVSAVLNNNLNYYIKNLEVFIKEPEYEISNIKYDYYTESEVVTEANIRIYYNDNENLEQL